MIDEQVFPGIFDHIKCLVYEYVYKEIVIQLGFGIPWENFGGSSHKFSLKITILVPVSFLWVCLCIQNNTPN